MLPLATLRQPARGRSSFGGRSGIECRRGSGETDRCSRYNAAGRAYRGEGAGEVEAGLLRSGLCGRHFRLHADFLLLRERLLSPQHLARQGPVQTNGTNSHGSYKTAVRGVSLVRLSLGKQMLLTLALVVTVCARQLGRGHQAWKLLGGSMFCCSSLGPCTGKPSACAQGFRRTLVAQEPLLGGVKVVHFLRQLVGVLLRVSQQPLDNDTNIMRSPHPCSSVVGCTLLRFGQQPFSQKHQCDTSPSG